MGFFGDVGQMFKKNKKSPLEASSDQKEPEWETPDSPESRALYRSEAGTRVAMQDMENPSIGVNVGMLREPGLKVTWAEAKRDKALMHDLSLLKLHHLPHWRPMLRTRNLRAELYDSVKEMGRGKAFISFAAVLAEAQNEGTFVPDFYLEWVEGCLFPENLGYDEDTLAQTVFTATKLGYQGLDIGLIDGLIHVNMDRTPVLGYRWEKDYLKSVLNEGMSQIGTLAGFEDLRSEYQNVAEGAYRVRAKSGAWGDIQINQDLTLRVSGNLPEETVLGVFEAHVRVLYDPVSLLEGALHMTALGSPMQSTHPCISLSGVRDFLNNAGYTTIQKGMLVGPGGKINVNGLKLEDGYVTFRSSLKLQPGPANNAVVLSQIFGRELK